MEKTWNMKLEVGLYPGLYGFGFPKVRGTFMGVPRLQSKKCWVYVWRGFPGSIVGKIKVPFLSWCLIKLSRQRKP